MDDFPRQKQMAQGAPFQDGPVLFDPVVGRFLGDDHIVDVAFFEAGLGDAYEAGFLLEFRDCAASAITHSRFEPSYKLVHKP